MSICTAGRTLAMLVLNRNLTLATMSLLTFLFSYGMLPAALHCHLRSQGVLEYSNSKPSLATQHQAIKLLIAIFKHFLPWSRHLARTACQCLHLTQHEKNDCNIYTFDYVLQIITDTMFSHQLLALL